MKPKEEIILTPVANGRIDMALMQRVNKRFDNVVAFDRKAPTPLPNSVAIPADNTSDVTVREGFRVLREHHGTRIAHCGAFSPYYDFLHKPSPTYDEIKVEGTRPLLQFQYWLDATWSYRIVSANNRFFPDIEAENAF